VDSLSIATALSGVLRRYHVGFLAEQISVDGFSPKTNRHAQVSSVKPGIIAGVDLFAGF
jgi:hypothetical protein